MFLNVLKLDYSSSFFSSSSNYSSKDISGVGPVKLNKAFKIWWSFALKTPQLWKGYLDNNV